MYTCPCCGHAVFASSPGSYDVCPICFGEDDGRQLIDPFSEGGSNPMSLVEAQVGFVQFGACERRMLAHVRPPRADEAVDPLWFPLWKRRVELPDADAPKPDCRSPRDVCYWLR